MDHFYFSLLIRFFFCASLHRRGKFSQSSLSLAVKTSTWATPVSNLSLRIHLKLCCRGQDKCGWLSEGWLWKHHKHSSGTKWRQKTFSCFILTCADLQDWIWCGHSGKHAAPSVAGNGGGGGGVALYEPIFHLDWRLWGLEGLKLTYSVKYFFYVPLDSYVEMKQIKFMPTTLGSRGSTVGLLLPNVIGRKKNKNKKNKSANCCRSPN